MNCRAAAGGTFCTSGPFPELRKNATPGTRLGSVPSPIACTTCRSACSASPTSTNSRSPAANNRPHDPSGVRPMRDHSRSGSACVRNHLERYFAHARQAHFGQKIKIVFVDNLLFWAGARRNASRKPDSGSSSMASKTATEIPCCRNTPAAYRVPSGGYGCILRTCLRSYGK